MEEVEEFKSKKDKNKEEKPKFVARTTTDVQRIKLEKLMKNPVSNITNQLIKWVLIVIDKIY